jgi:hypothetical protein
MFKDRRAEILGWFCRGSVGGLKFWAGFVGGYRRAEILGWFCRGFGKVRKMKFGNSIFTLSGGKFKKLNSKNIDKSMFNICF